jgi:hypothetical protein
LIEGYLSFTQEKVITKEFRETREREGGKRKRKTEDKENLHDTKQYHGQTKPCDKRTGCSCEMDGHKGSKEKEKS